jgi:hypothetical protein
MLVDIHQLKVMQDKLLLYEAVVVEVEPIQ